MSGATTRAPFGSEAASSPISSETVDADGDALDGHSDEPGECGPAGFGRVPHRSQLVRPPRQSARVACSASNAGAGGRP